MLLFNSHCKTSYTLYQFFFFLIPAHGTFKKKKLMIPYFVIGIFILLSKKNDIIFVTESDFSRNFFKKGIEEMCQT